MRIRNRFNDRGRDDVIDVKVGFTVLRLTVETVNNTEVLVINASAGQLSVAPNSTNEVTVHSMAGLP